MPLEPMLIGELGFNAPKHLSNSGPRHLNRGGWNYSESNCSDKSLYKMQFDEFQSIDIEYIFLKFFKILREKYM